MVPPPLGRAVDKLRFGFVTLLPIRVDAEDRLVNERVPV
jgi:hypothetical protein